MEIRSSVDFHWVNIGSMSNDFIFSLARHGASVSKITNIQEIGKQLALY